MVSFIFPGNITNRRPLFCLLFLEYTKIPVISFGQSVFAILQLSGRDKRKIASLKASPVKDQSLSLQCFRVLNSPIKVIAEDKCRTHSLFHVRIALFHLLAELAKSILAFRIIADFRCNAGKKQHGKQFRAGSPALSNLRIMDQRGTRCNHPIPGSACRFIN